jgi:hypothetical protein
MRRANYLLRFVMALMVGASAAHAAPRLLFASPNWAAFDRMDSCAAIARSEVLAPPGRDQAHATISFDRRRGGRHGELHLRLSRPARPGTAALLQVGGASFLLATRGADAWSSGPAQESALVAAMRAAGDMRVRFRSADGAHSDRYLLPGAPTANDAAAAACAGNR